MPDLLIQSHEIKIVPGLDNLSVGDADDGDPSEVDRRLSRISSQELSFVLTTHGTTRSDFVTFGNHVFDDDLQVREALAEDFVKRSIPPRTSDRVRRIIRQTVRDTILVEHLLDRLSAPVVPNLVKPAT